MKRFSCFSFLTLCGSLLGIAHAGHAQSPAMSLLGSVQSEEKQPLAGAAITAIHMPSGTRHAAASDAAGRFVIPNLMVGGPYLIQVGEGGYRPQTVENTFLETCKTANFTVTLSKLGKARDRNAATNNANGTTLTLAKEAAVGGPVLMTTSTAPVLPASAPPHSATGTASQHTSSATAMAAPLAAATSDRSAATGGAAASAAGTPAAAPARPSRYSRDPSRRTGPRPKVEDPIVPGHFDAKTGNYIYETGQLTTLKLANGTAIANVGVNSTESFLYHFLTTPSMQVDTVDLTHGWYNFDRVFFDAGKASLTAASVSQLRNIATILRAFPNARIKLGGYTDSTGTYKVNRQLSEARARTAWASLVDMGISPTRLEARGYGSNYAIAANATEEGRSKNRRLSLRVLQK